MVFDDRGGSVDHGSGGGCLGDPVNLKHGSYTLCYYSPYEGT